MSNNGIKEMTAQEVAEQVRLRDLAHTQDRLNKLMEKAEHKMIAEQQKIEWQSSANYTIGTIPNGNSSAGLTFAPQAQKIESMTSYLERTQPMRVVALDEANKLMMCHIGRGGLMTPNDVVHAAKAFADFLIEGKTP